MRYSIVAIGQLKRGFYRDGVDHFLKRLAPYAKVEMLELREAREADAPAVKAQESEALLKAATGHLVALDERGLSLRSSELATRVTQLENQAISHVSILLGGAEGHSDRLRRAVNESWSLSSLTLPHELARLVLVEQLYRAETIRAGHPYHRE
jgi:23S rRNA (pseudouridine1915-N3)-methyltransferase